MKSLERFSSGDVSDALNKLGGFETVGQLTNISPMVGNQKIIGPAYTAEYVFVSNDNAPNTTVHHVDTAPEGSIIVIKSPENAPNAVWGGLMTARAKVVGVKGVIIDGRFRDEEEIEEMNFPVFATGKSTMGAKPFCRLSTVGEPITIGSGIYSVIVKTGDIIVADKDGVARIPMNLVDQVVKECQKNTEIDARCMADIKSGSSIKEAFARHRN